MTATLEAPRVEVRVSDLVGQQHMEIHDVDPATPVADIIGASRVQMALLPSVEWQLRDELTSRLLRRDQPIGDVASEGRVELTVQPDARLG